MINERLRFTYHEPEKPLIPQSDIVPSKTIETTTDFIDQEGLANETKRVVGESGTAYDLICQSMRDAQLSRKEKAKWDNIVSRSLQLRKTEIRDPLADIVSSSKGETEEDASTQSLYHVLCTAKNFLLCKNLESQRKFAEQHGFLEHYKYFEECTHLLFYGDINTKIEGVSIKDMATDKNLPPPVLYKALLTLALSDEDVICKKAIQENELPIMDLPNLTKLNTMLATREIMALNRMSFISPQGFDTARALIPNNPEAAQTIISAAKEIVKRVVDHRKKMYDSVLDPNSPDFSQLRDLAQEYLMHEDALMAIICLGVESLGRIYHGYRTAKALGKINVNNSGNFYAELATSIKEIAHEIMPKAGLLTSDDVPTILDKENPIDTSDIPKFEGLGIIVNSISQRSSRQEYSIDPQNVNWQNLIPPTSVQAKFLRGPNKFDLSIHYQNEDGKALDIPLTFDLKKGEFDWGFMEAPDDPDMKDMKNAVLLAAKSILLDVQKQAEAEYQQKQKERREKAQPQRPTQGRKIRSDGPYVPRQKEKRQERPRRITPFEEALEGPFTLPVRERVKKYVTPPEAENLRRMMQGISPENQAMITDKLMEFNETGAGRFKARKAVKYEGKPAFELRAGDYLALVTEVSPTDESVKHKRQTFEVYKIVHR